MCGRVFPFLASSPVLAAWKSLTRTGPVGGVLKAQESALGHPRLDEDVDGLKLQHADERHGEGHRHRPGRRRHHLHVEVEADHHVELATREHRPSRVGGR